MRFSVWLVSGVGAALRHIDLSDLKPRERPVAPHPETDPYLEREKDFASLSSVPAYDHSEAKKDLTEPDEPIIKKHEEPEWEIITASERRDEVDISSTVSLEDEVRGTPTSTAGVTLTSTEAAVSSAREDESYSARSEDKLNAGAIEVDRDELKRTPRTDELISELMLENDALTETPIDWFGLPWNARHADPEWLAKNLTHVQFLKEPRCESLGYMNFVYRSTSFAMRQSLRHNVLRQQAREIKFDYDRSHADPVYSWLTQNFVIPNIPASSSELPPLVRIVFPIGRPCVEETPECAASLNELKDEADKYQDILLGDYPDTSEFQGLKFAGVLDYFDRCRGQSRWQWLTRVEPHMVVNVPNVVYYARRQDLLHAQEFGDQMPLDSKKLRPEYSVPPDPVKWWIGHVLTDVEVMHEPIDHPNAEAYYYHKTYPPYTSKRFHLTHRRFVRELAHRFKKRNIFYRNEDSMIGILAQDMNKEYGTHFKPYHCPGLDIQNTADTLRLLCGRNYKGPNDDEAPARAKEISTPVDCDCRRWLAYPPVDAEDRRKVLRDMRRRCTFKDYYFSKAVSWL